MDILIKKLGKTVSIEWDDLPSESQHYILAYGLRQSLNDSIASAKTTGEMEGLLDKRLDALRNGTMGVRQDRETADPITAEAVRLAKTLIRSRFKGQRIDKEALESKARELAQHPKIREEAQKIVAQREKLKSIDLEID